MYLQLNSRDLPKFQNGMEQPQVDISFKIEHNKVIAFRIIKLKRYKIEKNLTTNGIDYLWKVLENLVTLPDEFWVLDFDN